MYLGRKLLLILGTVALGCLALLVLVHEIVIVGSFEELELEHAEADLRRLQASLRTEIDSLTALANDWAIWDTAYEFVLEREGGFTESNLGDLNLRISDLTSVQFVDLDGDVFVESVDSSFYSAFASDPDAPPADFTSLAATLHERCFGRLWAEDGVARPVDGLASICGQVLVVSAQPIREATTTAPPVGTLVMARLLGPEAFERVKRRAQVEFVPVFGEPRPDPAQRDTQWHVTSESLSYTMHLNDVFAAPVLDLAVHVPRTLSARGRYAAWVSVASAAVGLIIVLVLLTYLLRIQVVRPIEVLSGELLRVGGREGAAWTIEATRRDELGTLIREIERMTRRLAESRQGQAAAARKAGRAEVAASILHNVGNGLNAVQVSSTLIRETVEGSEADALLRDVLQVVAEHEEDFGDWVREDEQGRRLASVLLEAGRAVTSERARTVTELQRLTAGVEHVRTVLARQRQLAGSKMIAESFALGGILGEALQIARLPLGDDGIDVRVLVAPSDEGDEVAGPKHRILEVLVNMLNNAGDALSDAGTREPKIEVRAGLDADRMAWFEVQDNGPGVQPEHAASLFQAGFTTKSYGTGIGLSSSASMAESLGGSLDLVPTPGQEGATFRLEVPVTLLQGARAAA